MGALIAGHDMEPKYGGRFLQLMIYVNTSESRRPLVVRVMRAARGPQRDATIFGNHISSLTEWSSVSNMRPCHTRFYRFSLRVNTTEQPDIIVDRVRRALRSTMVVMNTELVDGPEAVGLWEKFVSAATTDSAAQPWPE